MSLASTTLGNASVRLSLARGAELLSAENGNRVIRTATGRITLEHLTAGTGRALELLGNGGATQPELDDIVLQSDGPDGLARFYYHLGQLSRRGLVWRSVRDEEGERLALLAPVSPSFTYPGLSIDLQRAYALSRFAFTRVEEGQMIVESPLSHARLILCDWRAGALLQALATPMRVLEVASRIPALSVDATTMLMELLLNAATIGEADDSGVAELDRLSSLRTWEFHDLLFHARSREGRHDLPIGATCRFAGKLDPAPALKPVAGREIVELKRPELDQLRRNDVPFAKVIEQRRSVREYGDTPITSVQLGEFLFRVARAENLRHAKIETGLGPVAMEFTSRPYPAGGALYELELYVAINVCDGLAAGLYHYDPMGHRLARLTGQTTDAESLLNGAAVATGILQNNLQVLLILAARFHRLSWKYSAIAYALILKHVGVLYQTMYLTATAMELAPCAVGCGNADLFARAAGTDYYAESSVGEFLLGSRRATSNAIQGNTDPEGSS